MLPWRCMKNSRLFYQTPYPVLSCYSLFISKFLFPSPKGSSSGWHCRPVANVTLLGGGGTNNLSTVRINQLGGRVVQNALNYMIWAEIGQIMRSDAKISFECSISKGGMSHFMEFQEGSCPLGHLLATGLRHNHMN